MHIAKKIISMADIEFQIITNNLELERFINRKTIWMAQKYDVVAQIYLLGKA